MPLPDISVGAWFAARAARSPHRRALTFEGTTWTFAQVADRVARLAAALRAGGVNHGDRVSFVGANQPAALETWLAASRIGAVYVPLNFRLAGPELAFIVGDAGSHTVIAGADSQGTIDEIRAELPVRRYLGLDSPGVGWESYESLVEATAPLPAPEVNRPEELSVIMYTSGTTGRPKGVMLSHENIWLSNVAMLSWIDIHADDVTLAFSPLFHIAGLNFMIGITWMRGGEVVLHRAFDAQRTLEDIARYQVRTLFGVPAMFIAISQLPTFASADLSSVRIAVSGGAPAPEPLLRTFADRGIGVLQGYGLTETAPAAIFLVAEFALAKLGAAGQPHLYIEAKLVGDDGATVTEPGARGEVCLRGPNITKGYWNRPDATAAAIDEGGWFHTGDVGEYDEDGFVYIVDRLKDMVISGGENVYPAEVESVLFGHPAVAEVAVIGLPDPKWGEAVTAVVATKPGQTVTLEQLRDYATTRLARYKLPNRLHVVADLPRNPTGKVLKYQLRDDLAGR
ncbi:MAG: long-chain fatty acid--CoA ligase [Dermatophilaceae bacterium]